MKNIIKIIRNFFCRHKDKMVDYISYKDQYMDKYRSLKEYPALKEYMILDFLSENCDDINNSFAQEKTIFFRLNRPTISREATEYSNMIFYRCDKLGGDEGVHKPDSLRS